MDPKLHVKKTQQLSKALDPGEVYQWLMTIGFFPEAYVLPPCFYVTKYPSYGTVYFPYSKKFTPSVCECQDVHYPKTDLTDRTFGIIDPKLYCDISYTITENWGKIIDILFDKKNKVCSYSFPIPLNSKDIGRIGTLRSGRMIYEYLEMVERDLTSKAYEYDFLFNTDVKNFYPSIYTHSIPWAIHGKELIRKKSNRNNYNYFGNRLDKLLQNANDGCTNGIPIGPAVSDLIAEIVLSGVDRVLSNDIKDDEIVVRFKDDYRILVKSRERGRTIIKSLQAALKEFKLELNDEKTKVYDLPNGLMADWKSKYLKVNPHKRFYYSIDQFKMIYFSVVEIDKENPGSGVVDRFLADLITKNYKIRIKLKKKDIPVLVSLLIKLGNLRLKAFPKVLSILEIIINTSGNEYKEIIEDYLVSYMSQLSDKEPENRYLLTWICYFLKANTLESKIKDMYDFKDPILRAVYSNRFTKFAISSDFKIFEGVKSASKRITMYEHLDVFKQH